MNIDVHLLVHERTQAELHEAFPQDRARLHFVADSLVNIWFLKIGKFLPGRVAAFTLGAISHLETQIRQRSLARSLVDKYRFDVVHEPIPVSPQLPSMMFGLSVPVIIGPMNGGMEYPPNYNLASRFERTMFPILRSTARVWNRILPGKINASLLLVANKRTYDALPINVRRNRVAELVENGVDVRLFQKKSNYVDAKSIQIIFIGRLVDLKCVNLLIAAFERLIGNKSFHLHIIGDGPLRSSLEQQAAQMSITAHVHFHGHIPQSAVAEFLRNADIFVLPSMRECGGAVILEAMASGVPVIATKWGGPVDYIVEDSGILIPPATPDVFVNELASAILWMADNPQARVEMGKAGRKRAELLYDWRVKAKAILEIYESVVYGRLSKCHILT